MPVAARQKEIDGELATRHRIGSAQGRRLHPGARRQDENYVGDLEGVFAAGISHDTEDATEQIRRLISRVVLTPEAAGFAMWLDGRLSEPMEAPNLCSGGAHRTQNTTVGDQVHPAGLRLSREGLRVGTVARPPRDAG
jgi:hypothetical protein